MTGAAPGDRPPVPLWARATGAVVALVTAALVAAGGALGAIALSGADASRDVTLTLPQRPALALALGGFTGAGCHPGDTAPAAACASSASTRLLGSDVRVVAGPAGAIEVRQHVRVRAAGPALADRFLDGALARGTTTAAGARIAAPGWNAWDPRLLRAESTIVVSVPPGVGIGPLPPAPRSGSPPNAPNVPNTPNTPTGRAGHPIEVPAGTIWNGSAAAWSANVTVEGHVTGDVVVVGGTATIAGTVDGSVRVWDGAAVVSGHVARDVEVVRGTLGVDAPATVAGHATVWKGPAPSRIDAAVGGPVEVVDGGVSIGAGGRAASLTAWHAPTPVQVDGTIAGDAGMVGGALRLGPGAAVQGHVHLWRGATCAGQACAAR